MFGMGWQEIMIILVIAVLVIGPEQLPQVARTLGKLMAQFRRASNDLRDTINREFTEHEEFKDFKEFSQSIDSEVRSISYSAQEYVEREVAKEEAELKKLEAEVESAAGEGAAEIESASDTASKWTPTDLPADESSGAESSDSVPEQISVSDQPSDNDSEPESKAEGESDARKVTA